MKRRINIGFVIDDIDNYFSNQAAIGAEEAAKALDANLIVFPGHYIGKTDSKYVNKKFEYQYNAVFSLPTERNVDIIYILQGMICSRANLETQRTFLKSMPNVPIVCLFSDFEGYHSVTFNNKSGLSSMLDHLIEKHNAKDIGYVSGPETNRDARERLDIYRNVLKEKGIAYDARKVVYGDFTMNSEDAVNELLDQNDHLDAIVFANDCMAVGGYSALSKRGLIPGKDILVGGFDDDAFAISMEPPLTTVEASSAALAFKAVLNAENYINGTALQDMTVDTHLVQRNSCGCENFDVESMYERLKLNGIPEGDDSFIKAVLDFLLKEYNEDELISSTMTSFLVAYKDLLNSEDIGPSAERMTDSFSEFLKTDIFERSTREKCFNLFQTLQTYAIDITSSDSKRVQIFETFAHFFRRLTFSGIFPVSASGKNTRMRGFINRSMGEVFLVEGGKDIPYEHLLGGFNGMGMEKTFLYLFQGNIKNQGSFNWMPPTSILLKAINDKDGLRTLPDEQQLLRTESIFDNEYITGDDRRTMIVSPLFVGEDFYGLLVNEVKMTDTFSLSSLASQLSVTLRSLFMIEEQNKVKQALQNSLERFIRDNTKLEEIAQKDELTGLYNRRGFITNAEKAISDPANQGKIAIICYADLDNLKVVNDEFGHDDGDFALKTIAQVLQESFRDSDIIGRFGGDEFIALAITGADCDIEAMKNRIEKVTKRYNKFAAKPYNIEMSTGIYKFRVTGNVDLYDMINSADVLLYQEKLRKKAGRDIT